MAFAFFLHRPMAAFGFALSLAACTTDALTPPARIDATTRVGAIGAVDAPQPDEALSAYPVADTPFTTFSESSDSTIENAPRQMGQPEQTLQEQMLQRQAIDQPQRLPMIDSEPVAGDGQAVALASSVVPSGGVDMDAMLGVEPVVGLAQEQKLDIAEGNASQPVVGGIGEDTVRQLGGPAVASASIGDSDAGDDPDLPPLTPEQIAAEEAKTAQFQAQQRRVMLRQSEEQSERQVAFLPRADNPLSEPLSEPDFTGRMPASELSCRQRLKKLGVEFADVARIAKGRACGIDHPIKLSGLSGGIDVKPAVTLNCQVTEAFAKWVKNELAPSARYRYLSGIKTIKPLGGYSCRTMNSKRGNPMSEHARGNAIDVGKFVLKSGKEIDVRKPGFFAFREKGLLKAVRSDSCKYFSTVLGPGSDASHKDHFHFDLRPRKSGYRHCD